MINAEAQIIEEDSTEIQKKIIEKSDSGKQWTVFLLCLVMALAVTSIFSSSTSPLYDIFYADYYGNASSLPMLMGKSWLKGVIPYIDLYASGGPLFYLLQAFGWFAAGRTGVYVIQVFCMTLCLFFMYRTLNFYVSRVKSCVLLFLMIIPLMGTLTGGNSEEEFCLTLSVFALYLAITVSERKVFNNKYFFYTGLLTGAMSMIKFTGSGAVYGIIIFLFIFTAKKKGLRTALYKFFCFLCGFVLCTLPFFIYFYINNALMEMLQAVFIHNFKALWVNGLDVTLLLHKCVKCISVILLIAGGCICSFRFKKSIGSLMGLIGIGLLCFTLSGSGYWHIYLPAVFCIPLFLAVLCNLFKNNVHKIAVLICALCAAMIYVIPIRHFAVYVMSEDLSSYRQLAADIRNYQEKTGNRGLFMVDVPAYMYLETDVTPSYFYFAQQSEYNKVNNQIREQLNNYVIESCTDTILVVKSSGGVYLEMGNYVMCDSYYYGREVLAVYEYLPE